MNRRFDERYLERLDDGGSDLVLNLERVIDGPVEGLRPDVVTVIDTNQLRRNSEGVAGPAHAPFQHICNTQRLRNVPNRCLLAFEVERRGARGHANLGNLGQHVDELFRHAIGKIFLVLLFTHVDERQHGDGFFRDRALPDRRSFTARGGGLNVCRTTLREGGGLVHCQVADTNDGYHQDQQQYASRW